MKKTLALIAIVMAATCTWLSSCDKADEYVKPTVSGLEITPNPCYPGDTVKAYLVYAVAGDCWYWYSQKFTIPTGFKTTSEYRGTCNDPSFIYFVVPDTVTPGSYSVYYKGQITITSGENLWGDAYEFDKQFTVKQK